MNGSKFALGRVGVGCYRGRRAAPRAGERAGCPPTRGSETPTSDAKLPEKATDAVDKDLFFGLCCGAKIRPPKTQREGHLNAFRLVVAGKKFIFSVASEDQLEKWKTAMQEGSGTGIGLFTATAVATVRNGRLIGAKQTRTLRVGAVVTVFEEAICNGHRRGRISPKEWVSIQTAGGAVLFISANEFSVACPPGAVAGQIIGCQAPTGQIVQVVVPPGVVSGQVFQAQIPKQSPTATATCPSCGTGQAAGYTFCTECGTKAGTAAAATGPTCTGCGVGQVEGFKFCTSCGKAAVTTAAPAAAAGPTCPSCGVGQAAGYKFCTSCGKAAAATTAAPAAAAILAAEAVDEDTAGSLESFLANAKVSLNESLPSALIFCQR